MIFTKKTYKGTIKFVLFTLFLLSFSACDNDVTVLNSVYWKDSSLISAAKGSSAIVISGAPGVSWSAEIVDGEDWCSFNSSNYSLKVITGFITDNESLRDENLLYVYCKSNTSAENRKAKISFQFHGKDAQTFTLTQTPSFSIYTETPTNKEKDNYQYVTHYTTLNNKTVRNYSICFDETKRASLWVAYPLHACYLGKTSRTDAWDFDPIVSVFNQANCVSRSYGGPYDRGHQIASADRLANRNMNVQTFYMSNLTPQLNRLNQDMWANLEIKVRSLICSDTLFVVTGAYFDEESKLTTTDGGGNTVPLPTHYYKVLLRTVSGSSGKTIAQSSDNELKSIGFWVEHKSYGNIDPPRSICMSVADIEAITGFTFFPQVSESVKTQNNPNQWDL